MASLQYNGSKFETKAAKAAAQADYRAGLWLDQANLLWEEGKGDSPAFTRALRFAQYWLNKAAALAKTP